MKDFWENMSKEDGISYFTELNKDSGSHVYMMDKGEIALDFGCGVGRNIPKILENFNTVVAYDLPNILEIAKKFDNNFDKSKCIFTSKWEEVSNKKFDCILADSTFNHIEKKELISYLQDMKKMTNKIVIHGKRVMDDGERDLLPILNKYFNVEIIKSYGINNNEDAIAGILRN